MANEKSNTGALDVGAMYQIGASGAAASAKKAASSETSIIGQIGRYALGYYMKAADNLRDSRKEESQIFAQLEGVAVDADFALADVQEMKDKLTKSNKKLNSVRGMLLPNHPDMVKAQEDKDEVLKNILKLQLEYKGFKDKVAYQHQVNNGLFVVGENTENQAIAGWGEGNTAMQMYNTSLLINGSLENALSVVNGEIYVNFQEIDAPFDGGWDNPLTDKVEDKEDFTKYMAEISGRHLTWSGKMKLSDMQFATHANPNQPQHANNYISGFYTNGTQKAFGENPELDGVLLEKKSSLESAIGKMTAKEKVDYFFDSEAWYDEDGNPLSLIDDQISKVVNDKNNPLFKEFDKNGDEIIDADEVIGAREIMKLKILNDDYPTDAIVKTIHDKGIERYNEGVKVHKQNNPEPFNAGKIRYYEEQKEIEKLKNDILDRKDHAVEPGESGDALGKRQEMAWKDAHGSVEAGWHLFYFEDGKWYYSDARIDGVYKPRFVSDEAYFDSKKIDY